MRFILNEFLTPILEENESYAIRFYSNADIYIIEVLKDTSVVKTVEVSKNDLETELTYLRNDYQTADCREYQAGERDDDNEL